MTDHRQLGVALYNGCWPLLEKADRTTEEDDELLHQAHASAYHWLKAPECEPKNRVRAEWLCSRVYSSLGRAEPALHHAERALAIAQANAGAMDEFDLPFVYEALARANAVAGNPDEARTFEEASRRAVELMSDPEDKELVLRDLETI
jgi:tetratricopeptide (TPR) repeat protein